MPSSLLRELEAQITRYVKQRYFPRAARTAEFTDADLHFFARGVAEVSAAFTSERAERPQNYFNRKEFRSGYLLYFLLANLPKAWHCLEQLRVTERFSDHDPLHVLDLGCGPGTGALATAEYYASRAPGRSLEILAVDQNGAILEDARTLFAARAAASVQLTTRTARLHQRELRPLLQRRRFDIIWLMNVLNECGSNESRETLVRFLLQEHLSDRGALIIIEPGLQHSTRDLMQLRDNLLAPHPDQPAPRILAPCLHHDRCPMLAQNRRDWCHFYLPWERPQLIADLDRLVGLEKGYLKFSQLVLTHAAVGEEIPPSPPFAKGGMTHQLSSEGRIELPRYRVVSAPLRSKGKVELLLCPADGTETQRLVRLSRLDKDRSATTDAIERATRGDLVTTTSTDRLRPHDHVTIVQAFQR